jgi:hypothetical protein
MSRTHVARLCCALALIAVAGCASGPNLPDYVEPKLPPDKSASLEGFGAAYVTIVDNAKAPGSLIRMSNFGGNSVKLTPGRHRITVAQSDSNRFSMTTHTVAFTYDFKAGHVYRVGPSNRFNPFNRQLSLHDDTTDTAVDIAATSADVNTEHTAEGRPDLPSQQLAPKPSPVTIGQ